MLSAYNKNEINAENICALKKKEKTFLPILYNKVVLYRRVVLLLPRTFYAFTMTMVNICGVVDCALTDKFTFNIHIYTQQSFEAIKNQYKIYFNNAT